MVTSPHVSLFRYNRYGYPVFPQKPFGLPSPTGREKQQMIGNKFVTSPLSLISRPGLVRWILVSLVAADDL